MEGTEAIKLAFLQKSVWPSLQSGDSSDSILSLKNNSLKNKPFKIVFYKF